MTTSPTTVHYVYLRLNVSPDRVERTNAIITELARKYPSSNLSLHGLSYIDDSVEMTVRVSFSRANRVVESPEGLFAAEELLEIPYAYARYSPEPTAEEQALAASIKQRTNL